MKSPISAQTERLGVALAMSLFERLGFAFREQSVRDVGIDAHAELIENNEATGRLLAIQLKSGTSYFSEETEDAFVYRPKENHVKYWLDHSLPVLVCLCDLEQDAIYWQRVNKETAVAAGKGYKINVPKIQMLTSQTADSLRDILTPIVSPDRYTLVETKDQSHGTAKRYLFKAILNRTMSKAEIASVVRQLTNDGAKRRYHRNHLAEARWGDSDAHVVWTFVYPTFEDVDRNNYVCRSQWISDELAQVSKPTAMRGENIGDGIIVDWNKSYMESAEFWKSIEVTKENYLSRAIPLAEELISLSEIVAIELAKMSQNETPESTFLARTKQKLGRISEIDGEIAHLPLGPVECKDVRQKLLDIACYADNIALFYSDTGLEKWDEGSRLYLSNDNSKHMRNAIVAFKYELEKVR